MGFGSHRGTVIAGRAREAPVERRPVPPAREGSWEHVLHRAIRRDARPMVEELRDAPAAMEERGHRAIGVVHGPEREGWDDRVPTALPRRFDVSSTWRSRRSNRHPCIGAEGGPPGTFPFGV